MSLSASTIELAPLPALLAARTTTSALFLLVTVLALLVFFTLVSGKERSEVVAQVLFQLDVDEASVCLIPVTAVSYPATVCCYILARAA